MDDLELYGHHHEHHHHHDECGCGCGTDHEHHHHHEHVCNDPNCTDPSHHHAHHDSDGLVNISHHDGATIGAMKGVMPTADYDKAEAALAEQMRKAGQQITEAGGIIGHIKFVLTAAGKCAQISVTDVNEHIRRFEGRSSMVEGVAIVFALEDRKLKEILTHTIGSLFAKNE